jgi:hypothetical protein
VFVRYSCLPIFDFGGGQYVNKLKREGIFFTKLQSGLPYSSAILTFADHSIYSLKDPLVGIYVLATSGLKYKVF